MARASVGLCFTAIVLGAPLSSAGATVIDFDYNAVFSAKGIAVTTAVDGQVPYIDPASRPGSGPGGTNAITSDDFSVNFSGHYDTSDIVTSATGQSVDAVLTSMTSNVFGTVFYRTDITLGKTDAGVFTFGYTLASILDQEFDIDKVFSPTTITAKTSGTTKLPKGSSLTQTGVYKFDTDTLANFYGTSAKGLPQSYDGEFTGALAYHDLGADVANGKAGSTGGAGAVGIYGQLILSTPAPPGTPAVPEPASWAMMLAGFGLVGGAMRRGSVRVARAF